MDAGFKDFNYTWIDKIASSGIDGSLDLPSPNKANIPASIENALDCIFIVSYIVTDRIDSATSCSKLNTNRIRNGTYL